MQRKDIEEKYRWDLSKIYKSDEDFFNDYNYAKNLIPTVSSYKGRFTSDAKTFLEFMKLIEDISRKISKMYEYAHLSVDVEPNNDDLLSKYSQTLSLLNLFNEVSVFVDIEILENKDKVLELLKDENLKEYKMTIDKILRNEPHTLSKKEEDIIALADSALDSSYETFSSFRLDFDPVIIDGKEHFLNHATLLEFLKNKDESVRKQAYEKVYSKYKKYSNVYANTLIGNLKKDVFYSKVRKFNSPLEYSIFSDNVPKELFYKVLDFANNKYHNYLHEYINLRKELLKKDTLEVYDLNIPLVDNFNKTYSLDDAFSLIFEATKNLGNDYINILKKARDDRWIDYYTHEGKRTGAYSAGCYDVHPYILTNYTKDLESVFTLIHELGHSAHSYLSSATQSYSNHEYRIFVAEVASTVNENLLMHLLLKNATTKEEKAYLLYRKIEEQIGLIYRQPFFANFENILHEKIANNEGLSNQYITNLYHELSEKYYGDNVNIHEFTKYSCYYVPHFYYNYYVYKYTIGMCVSSVIAKKIADNDKEQIEKYIRFLKSGGSKYPVDLLSDAGVNPLDDSIYNQAFETFKNDVEEFKKCVL